MSRGAFGPALSLLLLLALPALLAAAAAEPAPTPNLVLVTLDTTRADRIGAWGWEHARTPNLDRLARHGVRFSRCDTAAPITLPSHATLLTGLAPPRHGVRDNATFVLPPEAETVTERLSGAGWDTAAVVAAAVLARHYGLAQGFATYDDDLGGPEAVERPAAAVTDAALARLATLEPPFFFWVHYFDPHTDYTPPARYAGGGGPQPLYDGEIAYTDEQLGRLLAALSPETTVLVVGDHGEMLGDGGELTHGLLLGQGARRVPLLAAGPGLPAGRTVDCLVRTADVAPTLLALAGLEPAAGIDGESLLPLLDGKGGEGCDRVSYSESFLPFFSYRWYPLRALSDGRWLYIHGTRPGLYDLAADPAETRDLAAAEPQRVATWRRRLEEKLAAAGEELDAEMTATRAPTTEEHRRLASLGYLGGGPPSGRVAADLPDPRDMTAVARGIEEASALLRDGGHQAALQKLYAILERDPENFPALNLSGLSLQAAGRCGAALNAFERAAAVNPRSAVPVLNGAGCLVTLGRTEAAEEAYAKALALDPTAPGAASNLALLRRERGELAAAEEALATAFAAGAHHPGLYLERGLVRAARGELPAALTDFEEAARRDPDSRPALENAARAASALGRAERAVELYRRLTELEPDRPDLWAALAELYYRDLGDAAAARRSLEQAIARERDPGRRARLEAFLADLR